MRIFALLAVAALVLSHADAGAQSPSASALALASLPDTNRPWTGQDYAKAADLLGKRGVTLPVSSDRRGAIIIQRLTALENLAALRNEKTPVATRFADGSKIVLGANSILSLYVNAMGKAEKYNDEVIRQVAFMLHASAASMELLDEFLVVAPLDDKNPARAESYRKMRAGVTTSYMSAAGSLSARDYFSESELSALLDAMSVTLSRLKKAFDPDSTKSILEALEAHKALLKDSRDIRKTELMIAELKRP